MKLATLRKRREFLRIRGGRRCATHAFVLETKRRQTEPGEGDNAKRPDAAGARFGFTVTKRLGNAVARNRIRRRLKAVLAEVAKTAARDHFDYVLIARAPAREMAFTELRTLLTQAFERVHQPPSASGARRKAGSNPAGDKHRDANKS